MVWSGHACYIPVWSGVDKDSFEGKDDAGLLDSGCGGWIGVELISSIFVEVGLRESF